MIHELLSNNTWIAPQINYLIWVQNLRIHCNGALDGCFLNITALGEMLVPTLVMCIIYWCISSNAGLYLFSLNSLGLLTANFFKMIACIYRPWVLSNEVKPIQAALRMSGGYSFPSGHCAMASTTWGGIAYLVRNKKIICSLIILLILLIAFSRTYVGVHTPQDIIAGLFIGLVLIFFTNFLLAWCEKDKKRYLYSMGIFSTISICALFYIIFKQYPQNYVDGRLLVDPTHAIYISVLYSGWIIGIFNGAFLCKRFFPFDAKQGTLRNKIIRGTVGVAILSGLFAGLHNFLFNNIWGYLPAFFIMFLFGFFITAIYPFVFTRIMHR